MNRIIETCSSCERDLDIDLYSQGILYTEQIFRRYIDIPLNLMSDVTLGDAASEVFSGRLKWQNDPGEEPKKLCSSCAVSLIKSYQYRQEFIQNCRNRAWLEMINGDGDVKDQYDDIDVDDMDDQVERIEFITGPTEQEEKDEALQLKSEVNDNDGIMLQYAAGQMSSHFLLGATDESVNETTEESIDESVGVTPNDTLLMMSQESEGDLMSDLQLPDLSEQFVDSTMNRTLRNRGELKKKLNPRPTPSTSSPKSKGNNANDPGTRLANGQEQDQEQDTKVPSDHNRLKSSTSTRAADPPTKKKVKKSTRKTSDTLNKYIRKKYPCDDCGKALHSKSQLQAHRALVHSKGQCPYTCPACGSGQRDLWQFRRHWNRTHSATLGMIGDVNVKAEKST